MHKTGLYWFTNDLRVADNPLLTEAASEVDQLICVYLYPQLTPFLAQFSGQQQLGAHRLRFVDQALQDLNHSLAKQGQRLAVFHQTAEQTLPSLIEQYNVTHLYVNRCAGWDETKQLHTLKQQFPYLKVVSLSVNSLFQESQLPFPLAQLPVTFTRFRKCMEPVNARDLLPVSELPSTPLPPEERSQPHQADPRVDYLGGETAGQQHCQWYFSHDFASHYKQTRNGLVGKSYSTKFSPWLALGCLSPAQLVAYIQRYEHEIGANESTYWIVFELLWREYFYWYAMKHGALLFARSGITASTMTKPLDQSKFHRWTKGETDFAIVNACMKQLHATGYLSNRGRQLAASCLIHELDMDWRYGAAYFETQLIDYDVASNWGNWQYLAGVGADPNPSRRFNLDKQTQMYDPHRQFITRWLGE